MTPTIRSQSFRLAVILENPVPGVTYALQLRDGKLCDPTYACANQLRFEALVHLGAVRSDGHPNLFGDFVNGPPADRFIYINSGQRAGQIDSCWDRRAKVKLTSLSTDLIRAATSTTSSVIEGRIKGSARDGGPCCATTPLEGRGWALAS